MEPVERLHIHGLPLEIDEQHLRAIFSQYGALVDCQLLDVVLGRADRAAFIRMSTVAESSWLVQNVNGKVPAGLPGPVSIQIASEARVAGSPSTLPLSTAPPVFAADGTRILPLGVLLNGTVRRWNLQKGFGFIVPEGGGPDVFVHARELGEGEILMQGSQVKFEAMTDPTKGPGMYRAKAVIGSVQKDHAFTSTASDNLFVTGLPMELTEETIQAIFGQYGNVGSVKKLPNNTGKTDTAALVRMGDIEQATWLVVNLNGNIPSGLSTPVTVTYAEQKRSGVAAAQVGFGPASLAQTPILSSPY